MNGGLLTAKKLIESAENGRAIRFKLNPFNFSIVISIAPSIEVRDHIVSISVARSM